MKLEFGARVGVRRQLRRWWAIGTLLAVVGLAPASVGGQQKAEGQPMAQVQPKAALPDKPARHERPLYRVPVEGITHPVFENAGKDDAIDIFLAFGPAHQRMRNLGEQLLEPLVRWRRRIMIDTGVKVPIHRRLAGNTINIVVHGMDDPKPVVDMLIQMYRRSDLPLSEVFLTRRSMKEGTPGAPVVDPRMPEATVYSDSDALWAAAFDTDAPLPFSEDPLGMLSVLTFRDGKVLNETRGMPFYFEGMRIVYGQTDSKTVPPDERTATVANRLRRELNAAFPTSASPPFFDVGRQMQRVSKVERGDRVGYFFAVERYTKEIGPFVVRYPGTFRYREYELLRGIEAAISRLDLEPVIFWHRGDVYAFSVWEKLTADSDSSSE